MTLGSGGDGLCPAHAFGRTGTWTHWGTQPPRSRRSPPAIRALPHTGEGLLRAGSALGSHVNGRHPDAAMRAQRHTHTHQAPSSSVRPARASHTQGCQKFRLVGTFTSTVPAAFKSSKKINTAPPQLSSLPGAPKLQVQPAPPPQETSPKAAGTLLSRRTVPDARALSTPPRRAGEAEDRRGATPSRPLPQPLGRPHDTHTPTLSRRGNCR